MSVRVGQAAIEELRRRLGPASDVPVNGPPPTVLDGPPFGLADLPPGITADTPDGWLWQEPVQVPPLRDPAAYRIASPAGDLLHAAPFAVLRDGDHDGGGDGGGEAAWSEQTDAYCRSSADVTMRGGTTSGVVYPLAICEIARHYRLRNVGGASAGAIAAAVAAAAELGRMARADGSLGADADVLSAARRNRGHVRPGFPGLADCMAWLAEADDEGGERFRVAQLFVPTARTRPLYRFVVAVMRGRTGFAPVLMVGAFGPLSKALTMLGLAGAVVAVMLTRPAAADSAWWTDLLAAIVGLAGPSLLAVGVLLAFIRVPALRAHRPAPPLREPVEPSRSDFAARLWDVLWPVLIALAGAALVAAALLWRPLALGVPVLALAWCALVLLLFTVVATSLWQLVRSGKQLGFGLVPGAAQPPQRRNLLDRVAGLAGSEPGGSRPLMVWLSDILDELAGLPDGVVLRFGHLWYGHDFDPAAPPPDVVDAADDPRRRRINLELMTSELVQARAYRLPFPRNEVLAAQDQGQLYFCADDLYSQDREVVPAAVLAALKGDAEPIEALDLSSGTARVLHLYPLPEPWNMPVAFAVRLSLALPALIQAVRLYRRADRTQVRDEFGRTLRNADGPLLYPAGEQRVWARELWFTDGGVTSNFPIHFFDSLLPLWPTFGINLGEHPTGNAHQDVWLPQDWEATSSAGAPLSGSFTGFLMSILDTASDWSDNAQTRMPGYRGRVASVRQRPDEGGNNLFMPKAVVASLALRGALAGGRLRRRFSCDPMWRRHQWLRRRTAMGNLEQLRDSLATSTRDPNYRTFGAARLAELIASLQQYDTEAPPPSSAGSDPWFQPVDPAYWTALDEVVRALGGLDAWAPLAQGTPQPAPVLRQTPPT